MGGSGAGLGYFISTKIGPTELPQAVAAFHSLVGLAATATAVGDFMVPHGTPDGFHNLATYLGAWMGSITTTGSLIAYGKSRCDFNPEWSQLNQDFNPQVSPGVILTPEWSQLNQDFNPKGKLAGSLKSDALALPGELHYF